jgi:hypothetical protein
MLRNIALKNLKNRLTPPKTITTLRKNCDHRTCVGFSQIERILVCQGNNGGFIY